MPAFCIVVALRIVEDFVALCIGFNATRVCPTIGISLLEAGVNGPNICYINGFSFIYNYGIEERYGIGTKQCNGTLDLPKTCSGFNSTISIGGVNSCFACESRGVVIKGLYGNL